MEICNLGRINSRSLYKILLKPGLEFRVGGFESSCCSEKSGRVLSWGFPNCGRIPCLGHQADAFVPHSRAVTEVDRGQEEPNPLLLDYTLGALPLCYNRYPVRSLTVQSKPGSTLWTSFSSSWPCHPHIYSYVMSLSLGRVLVLPHSLVARQS